MHNEKRLSRFWKILLLLVFFAILVLFGKNSFGKTRINKKENNFSCSHQFSKKDDTQSCVRFLTEWECDYCGKIINWGGNHPEPNQKMTRPVLNALAENICKSAKKPRNLSFQ